MSKTGRQWKAAEKLEIIQDSDLLAVGAASRQHVVHQKDGQILETLVADRQHNCYVNPICS